jgi:hypothetical protein
MDTDGGGDTTFVPFFLAPGCSYAEPERQGVMEMRSFVVYLLLKILPESLTWVALLFILEREGISAFSTREEKASESKLRIASCTVSETTTSAVF